MLVHSIMSNFGATEKHDVDMLKVTLNKIRPQLHLACHSRGRHCGTSNFNVDE